MKSSMTDKNVMKSFLLYSVILALLMGLGAPIALADSLNVRMVGYYNMSGIAWNSCIIDDTLYVADYDMGLRVLDVNDPANPIEIMKYKTSAAEDVAARGNLAYIADERDGLIIIDLNNYWDPREIGRCETPGLALSVAISGNYAYVADYASLEIIDISDSTNPCSVGSIAYTGITWWVVVKDNYAYLANGTSGLIVVDITDPTLPVTAGIYNTDGEAVYVCIDDSFAYVADLAKGFKIINIARPDSMYLVGKYTNTACKWVSCVKVLDKIAYMIDEVYGLIVLDISNYATPMKIGYYTIENRDDWITLTIDGKYLYINVDYGETGVKILEYYGSTGVTNEETGGETISRLTSYISSIGPNPFRDKTSWRLNTKGTGEIKMQIYDITGRKVRTINYQPQNSGVYTISWDGRYDTGREAASGVYIYNVLIDGKRFCGKVTVLK